MVFDSSFSVLWKNPIIEAVYSIFRYTQLVALQETTNFTIQVVIFSLFLLFLALVQSHFVYFGFISISKSKKSSTTSKNIEKLLGTILIGVNTILFIPIVQIFLRMVVCIPDSRFSTSRQTCYDGVGITTAVFGVFGFLILGKEVFFLCYLMNEIDPFQKNPFSHPKPIVLLIRFLAKLLVTVYAYIDSFVRSA